MGLENYAYEEDSRLGSVFNSSKVDSEYDIRKIQESSLDHNGFVTKPENTYNALVEKGNHYEALKVTQASYKSRFQNDSVTLSSKKTNSMYESSEITPKTKYRTKKIKGYSSAVEDNSKCTYLVFSVLVAIIAITAAVMVFMILFGVISVRKCKECDLFEPKSEKQTQVNTNEDVKLKLQQLSEDCNSTRQRMDLYSKVTEELSKLLSMKNDEIANLTRLLYEVQNSSKIFESEIKRFKAIVNESEIKMNTTFNQISFVDARLNTVSSNISSIINGVYSLKDDLDETNRIILNMTLREGIQGPRGYNGSEGPVGKSANFNNCQFQSKNATGHGTVNAMYLTKDEGAIVGVFCTSKPDSQIDVVISNMLPHCICNFSSGSQGSCYIHYWYCN